MSNDTQNKTPSGHGLDDPPCSRYSATPETSSAWKDCIAWLNSRDEREDPHHVGLANLSCELEQQRNELLVCMEFLRDVITDKKIEEAIEEVGWNHENGTPIEWVDWCLKRVRENSLENSQAHQPE